MSARCLAADVDCGNYSNVDEGDDVDDNLRPIQRQGRCRRWVVRRRDSAGPDCYGRSPENRRLRVRPGTRGVCSAGGRCDRWTSRCTSGCSGPCRRSGSCRCSRSSGCACWCSTDCAWGGGCSGTGCCTHRGARPWWQGRSHRSRAGGWTGARSADPARSSGVTAPS